MTRDQLDKLAKIAQDKIKMNACIACSQKSGFTVGIPQETRDYKEGFTLGGAGITPLVTVICNSCSFVMFYSAIGMGVVNPRNGKYILGDS